MIANYVRILTAITLAATSAAPLAALAQAPSYATRAESINGTIATVANVNHIFVADDRGYTDDVTLRPGAAVMSNGLRLEPGQRVTVQGSAAGKTFLASRISTSGRSYAVSDAAYGDNQTQTSASYPVAYAGAYSYYGPGVSYGYYPYIFGSYGFYGGYRSYYRGYRPYYGSYGGYRPYAGFYGGYRPYHGSYGGFGGYRSLGGYRSGSIGGRGRSR